MQEKNLQTEVGERRRTEVRSKDRVCLLGWAPPPLPLKAIATLKSSYAHMPTSTWINVAKLVWNNDVPIPTQINIIILTVHAWVLLCLMKLLSFSILQFMVNPSKNYTSGGLNAKQNKASNIYTCFRCMKNCRFYLNFQKYILSVYTLKWVIKFDSEWNSLGDVRLSHRQGLFIAVLKE